MEPKYLVMAVTDSISASQLERILNNLLEQGNFYVGGIGKCLVFKNFSETTSPSLPIKYTLEEREGTWELDLVK